MYSQPKNPELVPQIYSLKYVLTLEYLINKPGIAYNKCTFECTQDMIFISNISLTRYSLFVTVYDSIHEFDLQHFRVHVPAAFQQDDGHGVPLRCYLCSWKSVPRAKAESA